jgi:hypothetical protein
MGTREDKITLTVEWSNEDNTYIGYCLVLFPYGGVCDASTRLECLRILEGIIEEELESLAK